ncbi:hypothetical protein CY0110_17947 [Crocosphaera chwakensis CCY0110]|uniref:Uncharacterized protein n=1 Tax=Crocosphaera chwakensis CCY0110 TaxID=391612 RepID=A3IIS1_9CHRO|nr:hypothetical protein CY0110_17947 [Crocosphaera chwakensis CCY0110]
MENGSHIRDLNTLVIGLDLVANNAADFVRSDTNHSGIFLAIE